YGGAEVGLVATDALEYPGAVVQAVRQDVDLGVLPGDEISVHPDEVGGLHGVCAPVRGFRALPWSPARCRPCLPDRVCADPRRARVQQPILQPWPPLPRPAQRGEAIPPPGKQREGRRPPAPPCPAMSGAEPCTGSNMPGPSEPSEALGSIPIEPVIIAASSERMSPNMFS